MSTTSAGQAGIAIEAVDIDKVSPADVAAWFAYDKVMTDEAPPLPFELRRYHLKRLPNYASVRLFVARDADRAVIGEGRALVAHTVNNAEICQIHVSVRADRRGRGIATALLRRVLQAAEAEGRTLLVAWTSDAIPDGARFARRFSDAPAQSFHAQRLRLADVDRRQLQQWIDDSAVHARDYTVEWMDGDYPPQVIHAVIDLRRVMNTAPRGSLALETAVLSPEQLLEEDRVRRAIGVQRWSLFARHRPTGDLVGFTEVLCRPADPVIDQGGTAVHPTHRGHRLGKWLKAAVLQRVLRERPTAVDMCTGTAASNEAMLDINRALGFSSYVTASAWQVPIERVRERLAAAGA